MKFTICLLAACAALVSAETLTQSERDRALSELYAGEKAFLDSISGLIQAQWNFKPAPDVWSIAECAEHITRTEDLLLQNLPKMMQAPAEPARRAETKDKDNLVLTKTLDRSQKLKAPEVLVPTHQWPTQAALIEHFRQSRNRTLDYVRDTQDDLRVHFFDHPVFKTLDAYQFILLIAAHTERHTAQLNEVKLSPNYPK